MVMIIITVWLSRAFFTKYHFAGTPQITTIIGVCSERWWWWWWRYPRHQMRRYSLVGHPIMAVIIVHLPLGLHFVLLLHNSSSMLLEYTGSICSNCQYTTHTATHTYTLKVCQPASMCVCVYWRATISQLVTLNRDAGSVRDSGGERIAN